MITNYNNFKKINEVKLEVDDQGYYKEDLIGGIAFIELGHFFAYLIDRSNLSIDYSYDVIYSNTNTDKEEIIDKALSKYYFFEKEVDPQFLFSGKFNRNNLDLLKAQLLDDWNKYYIIYFYDMSEKTAKGETPYYIDLYEHDNKNNTNNRGFVSFYFSDMNLMKELRDILIELK